MKSFQEALAEVEHITRCSDNPNIENYPCSIVYNIGENPLVNPCRYADARAYEPDPSFLDNVTILEQLEQICDQGSTFVNMLYTFRSNAKTLPVLSKDAPTEEKDELNRLSFELLYPQIAKVVELMKFHARLLQVVQQNVQMLVATGEKKVVPEAIFHAIVRLIDLVVRLDNLKDMKACIQNDFAFFKRSASRVPPDALPHDKLSEEINQLQHFLADPKCPKSVILFRLKEKLSLIPGSEAVFLGLITWLQRRLETKHYLLPDERWMMIRVLPHAMYLIDSPENTKDSLNVFKSKKLNLSSLAKIFKQHPVVPLFGDMHISLIYILQRCPHYDSSMEAVWGITPGEEEKVRRQYDLMGQWTSIRSSYDEFLARFSLLMATVRARIGQEGQILHTTDKWKDNLGAKLSQDVASACLEGLRLIAHWKDLVLSQAAFKYSRPASQETLAEHNANMQGTGIEYERVVRYNYSAKERNFLIDTIALIKSLASHMQRVESVVAPVLRLHIHLDVQSFVQDDINSILLKTDKKKQAVKERLLLMRSMVADWKSSTRSRPDETAARTNPKRKPSLSGGGNGGGAGGGSSTQALSRATPITATQLTLLRFYLQSLFDDKAKGMKKSRMFFNSKILEKAEVDLLSDFHRRTWSYPYLLDFAGSVRNASNLGDLWYREFYLEMTKCVQFPIAMSLPWVLIKEIIDNPQGDTLLKTGDMLEAIMYALDIYNDAANTALHSLKQQFVYDEIEAEVNLVFDQLVFLLSEHVYTYYKSVASARELDKKYRTNLQQIRGERLYLEVEKRRYDITTSQRHIQLLGRSVNLNFLISQYVNRIVSRDVATAIARFTDEQSDLACICELESVLSVIRQTHHLLNESMELESFDDIVKECDERIAPTTFRGRIATHIVDEVVHELIPHFTLNMTTERFIKPLKADAPGKRSSKVGQKFLYGSTFNRVFERIHRLERGFVGKVHMNAIVGFLGTTQLPWLVECVSASVERSLKELARYSEQLFKALDKAIKRPKYLFGSVICFRTFEKELQQVINYPDLRTGVLQVVREIGNGVAFLYLLESASECRANLSFAQTCTLLGLDETSDLGEGSECVDTTTDPRAMAEQTPLYHAATQCGEGADVDLESFARVCEQRLDQVRRLPMFSNLLKRLRNLLCQDLGGLGWHELDGHGNQDDGGVWALVHPERQSEFYRFWSALQFCFCMPKPLNELLSHEERFGDGFAWTGCTMIHLMAQRGRFEMFDYCYHTLRVSNYEHAEATLSRNIPKDESEDTVHFLGQVQRMRKTNVAIFSILESRNGGGDATRKDNLVIFHPPGVQGGLVPPRPPRKEQA